MVYTYFVDPAKLCFITFLCDFLTTLEKCLTFAGTLSRRCFKAGHRLPLLKHRFNPFKPEFTIVIFIHYNTRIAGAILDL